MIYRKYLLLCLYKDSTVATIISWKFRSPVSNVTIQ